MRRKEVLLVVVGGEGRGREGREGKGRGIVGN